MSRSRALAGVVALLATSAVSTAARADAAVERPPSVTAAAATAGPASVPVATSSTSVTADLAPHLGALGAAVVPMAASRPVRLRIAALGVDSSLMDLGLEADGSMSVPPSGFPAGTYTGAPNPGELGPAIIAGHVDWAGRPGVFFGLRSLRPGAEVTVDRADGSTAVFRVARVEQFAKEQFPTTEVYGDLGHAGLRLITCGGSFDRQARSYTDNLVVFADLVEARTT